MRKIFLAFIPLIILVAGCVGGAIPAGSGNMTLDQAIQSAAENIENNVQEGQKIAVLNFSSPTEQFSAYVLEELSTRLVNGKKLVVVDRRELDLIRQEENFQMSGEVSDESAQSIGKKLGAQLIVSGSLSSMGHLYRFRIRALSVESAAVEAASATDIRTGDTRTALLLSGAPPVSVNVKQPSAPAVQAAPQPAPTPAPVTVTPAAPPVQPAPNQTYKIGDRGPAGGLIFYDKGNNSDGWRYLEAAPVDLQSAQWGLEGEDVSGTGTGIGSGKRNTELIIAALNRKGGSGKAAQLCRAYTLNGYSDWFLPSKDELDLMYKNLKQKGLGNLDDTWYWSSSQYNNLSWGQSFSSGYQSDRSKYFTFTVRAVRAF